MKKLLTSLVLLFLIAIPMAAAAQTSWEIVRADYGSGNSWVDVTDKVHSLVQGNKLYFRVSGTTLGANSRRGSARTLRLQLRDISGNNKQVTFRDAQQVNLQVYGANQNSLRISSAVYGSGNRSMDVTSRLNSQVRGDQLNLQVNNDNMGGDPAPNRSKTLTVQYAMNGQSNQVVINEGDMLRLPYSNNNQGALQINRATYGNGNRSNDVTSRLNSQIQGGQLNLEVNNNNMGGDPAPREMKTLTVQYAMNGQSNQVVINEGDMLRLPYSNNNQGALQISRATYGSGNHSYDVTSRLNSQIQGNQLNLQVNTNTMGGDPAPNQAKTLTVQYVMNGQSNQVVINDGDMLRLPYSNNNQGALQISRATYGSGNRSYDVTSRLNSQIQGNQLNLQVNTNTMGGDPAPNQTKTLTVQYVMNGQSNQVVINDGDMLRLPYSNSNGNIGTGLAQRVRCESLQNDGNGRKYCAADTRGGVRLSRRLSDSDCIEGSSWGYDNGGVWVDKGCRADFQLQSNSRTTGGLSSATIPNGTELSVRTNEAIDSKTANVGQTFSAVLAADVVDSSGSVTIPKGSDARLVIRSASGGSMTSASDLVLDVDNVTVAGINYIVSTGDMVQQGGQGVGANQKTAVMVGGGAALGTLIGALVGGGKGAAIGAAIGAGAGVGTEVLTKGKQVRVPAETVLNFKLDQDLRLQQR
ncbi:MAG: hypothetical protein JWO13_490 [Acidobacteriales bacterium]|nr:hypothetical protein [Terriglobales bacterium]